MSRFGGVAVEPTVRRYGDAGPWILCLHGGPGAPGELAPVAERLGEKYRVLEPFERRSGSELLSVAKHVDDVRRAAKQNGVRKAAVLGFSSGAITALAFASSYPELTTAVVLVGSATLTAEARDEFKRRLAERLGEEKLARLAQLEGDPETEKRLATQASIVMEAYLTEPIRAPAAEWVDARGHHETWQDMLRLQRSGEHPEAFRSIECPVLMLHGSDDPHPGRTIHASLCRVLPHVEYAELPGCGHYPWLERRAAQGFYEKLEAWLAVRERGGPNPEPRPCADPSLE